MFIKFPTLLISTAVILTACNNSTAQQAVMPEQSSADLANCIRTVLTLDEGTWDYMGTIARMNGKFRTYQTTSIHASAGENKWSARSFGGDVGEDYSNVTHYVHLSGTRLIPLEDGTPNEAAALDYKSCSGPDTEGRYEFEFEYSEPFDDDSRLIIKNQTWRSAHGSHFTEDIFDETGRLRARRSGVYTPTKTTESEN